MFVYIVIDDVPEDFGQRSILGVFDNKKAAETEVKAVRQIDDYANQYVRVERYNVQSKSLHVPVRKRMAS